eukprot:6179898-Pleurochrysis_carterae.AAC.2
MVFLAWRSSRVGMPLVFVNLTVHSAQTIVQVNVTTHLMTLGRLLLLYNARHNISKPGPRVANHNSDSRYCASNCTWAPPTQDGPSFTSMVFLTAKT